MTLMIPLLSVLLPFHTLLQLSATVPVMGEDVPVPVPVSVLELGTKEKPLPSLAPWHVECWYRSGSSVGNVNASQLTVFVTGFAGFLESEGYEDIWQGVVGEKTSSRIVCSLDRKMKFSMNINYTDIARTLTPSIRWMTNGSLADALASKGFKTTIMEKWAIAGHSAGAHVILRRIMSYECGSVGAFVLLDPVDGASPYDPDPPVVIRPGEKVPFTSPALHIAAGLDGDHKPFLASCAPANLSNNHFYDAWRGPIWQINASKMGHMDLYNVKPGWSGWASLICPSHSNKTEKESYRQSISSAIVAFVDGIFTGRQENMLSVLEAGEGFIVPNDRTHDYHSFAPTDWTPSC